MTAGKFDPIDQRDELIERAKLGEISGEAADAEAIWLGLGVGRFPVRKSFALKRSPIGRFRWL